MHHDIEVVKQIEHVTEKMDFSGVISIMEGKHAIFEKAYGYAERNYRILNQLETRFGIASGTKGFTALAIGTLIQAGKLSLDSKAVECIDTELPHISPDVTITHLLTHTSGVFDYYDEETETNFDNFFVDIPWYQLKGPKDYIPLFINEPMKFEPGARFSYSNGGYILLGIIVEDLSGMSFQRYVEENIFTPCGMNDSGFFALNALPERTAYGYVKTEGGDWRTNIYNLPIIGASDGGVFTTVGDMKIFWQKFLNGSIIQTDLVDIFLSPHSLVGNPERHKYYGHGFWMFQGPKRPPVYFLEGCDAGVSFVSQVFPSEDILVTIISNTVEGVWPLVKVIHSSLNVFFPTPPLEASS